MDAIGVLIFGVAFLVCLAAWPRRSKRVPENVVQLVPKSRTVAGEFRAEIRAAGEVIEFPIKKGKSE